nr:SbmA/BacA-like family transporter [Pseudaminobacter soli]
MRAVGIFVGSEVGTKAKFMFVGLMVLLCGLSGMNVVNNYVGRNFMTAIAERQYAEFIRQAVFYIGVFACLTAVGALARFVEERLALLWREFLTRRSVNLYLDNEVYYRLDASGRLTHPDQRISEDIREFTVTTLSFVIMIFSASLTVLTFSGVLWSISPVLFGVAVLYAACGSYVTIALGRPLIGLNYERLDKEASFRSSLIHVRENAESVMLTRGEERQKNLLLHRLDDLIVNLRSIIALNRNLGFFTGGYNWMIQIVPDLIIAPAFIRGEIEFGVITQSGAAFAMLVGAFSLIVRQFNSISNFAAVVARLSSLIDAIEKTQTTTGSAIEMTEQKGCLAYDRVTLLSATDESPLVKELSLSIPVGAVLILKGPSSAPGTALFRATAGIPVPGSGRVTRPDADEISFVSQRPYLPPGTLREVLVRPGKEGEIADDQIVDVLRELAIESVVGRADGLDGSSGWGMSVNEQQLLAIANVLLARPRFVFLDRIDATLAPEQFRNILRMFSERSVTCIINAEAREACDLPHAVLEFGEGGGWRLLPNEG